VEDSGEDLVPIDEVARAFGLNASALRYYEERGLVTPSARRAGRRWYGREQVRRVGAIQFWQRSGLLRLDEIGEILDGTPTRPWDEVLGHRLADLNAQIEGLQAARAVIEHIFEHHPDQPPDGCDHYEVLLTSSNDDR